ncbi:hypothetical protein CRE_24741 [Caenorhabditis remanei]|uniref:Uncharacterized protein n=1 Tax=Caenorhabditis remanei TaxID=31234 RepID=E3N952_CAERE|nr:hypothetical protein CRE_24741 [Caenorhabditis remanei]
MRGSNGYHHPSRGTYDSYSNPPPSSGGHGQMVINMKTTVTTSGGQHNGLVVHSAIQSAGSPSTSQSSWMSPYSESPTRRLEEGLDLMRSNTSLHRSSPLPIQMVPSTSRETLISIGREGSSKRENGGHHHHQIPPKPPSPPPSPIYSFKGRDSPPDEFIQPTKLVLNVFRPVSHPYFVLFRTEKCEIVRDISQSSSGINVNICN